MAIKIVLILFLFASGSLLRAGVPSGSRLFCKVGNFSQKSVDLKCHPKSKIFIRVPKTWLLEDTKLKRNNVISLVVNSVQLASIHKQLSKKNLLEKKKRRKTN